VFVSFFMIVTLGHSIALADSIRLHDQAGSTAAQVKLSAVAQLAGPTAEGFADLIVATFRPGQKQLSVKLDSLRQTLSSRGANWGHLTLRGFSVCTVHLLTATTSPPLIESIVPAPAVANPTHQIDPNTPMTLLDHTLVFLTGFAAAPRRDLRIKFSERDQRVLARSAERDRLEFEPLAKVRLGRVPLAIRCFRGDRVVGTERVTAHVARRARVVVATRGIGRRDRIEADDVALREVFLDSLRSEPHAQLQDVVGRTAVSVLRPGAVIYPEHVRSQRLVRRNEIVTVHCVVGGFLIKTVARAMADGSKGEWIQVRNEHPQSRQTYMARVTRLREVVLDMKDPSMAGSVSLEEGAPARFGRPI
jgi:flagella basal body P-ring formation protein FlgA